MSAPAMLGRVAAARAATLRAAGADSAAARDVDVFRQALQALCLGPCSSRAAPAAHCKS